MHKTILVVKLFAKEKYILYTGYVGRPPKGKTERIYMKMDATVHKRLEAFRERFGISKTAAVEYLISYALDRDPNPFKIRGEESA